MEMKSAFIPGPRGEVPNGHGRKSLKRRKFLKITASQCYWILMAAMIFLSHSSIDKSFGSPFQFMKLEAAWTSKIQHDGKVTVMIKMSQTGLVL